MKKSYLLSLLAVVVGLLSFTAATNGGEVLYKLDPKSSTIDWKVVDQNEKEQSGTLKFKSGNIKIDAKRITGGFFYINLQSLKCTSISDAGFNADLMEWMRGESNLNAIKQKEVTLKVIKATRKDVPAGQDNFTISAQVNVKGIKKTVEFPALVEYGKKTKFQAKFTLSKDDFSMEHDLEMDLDVLVIKS